MHAQSVDTQQAVRRIVAGLVNRPAEQVDLQKSPTDCGLGSISLLVLRETCERQFGVYISDSDWLSFRTLSHLTNWIGQRDPDLQPQPARVSDPPSTHVRESRVHQRASAARSDDLVEEIEIGMPFTGINHLSESPLLKYLGDLRWRHVSVATGVPSKQIAGTEGNRLYATFFYVDARFADTQPMASFAENDRLEVVSRVARFGGSMLDGITWLLPLDSPGTTSPVLDSAESALAAGVPSIRLSNIFVRQFGGAEWLKKSRPANPGFETIRELAVAPDCYVAVKTAEKDGYFELPDSTYVPLTADEIVTDYKLIPERDVNGVGLVYFANYPVFLDICEREVLTAADLSVPEEMCNRRTLIRRRSAYLNNASWKDTVSVHTRVWVQNSFAANHAVPEMAPVRLFSNQRMYRKSDGRLMMVSTAEKLIFSTAMEELPFFDRLS